MSFRALVLDQNDDGQTVSLQELHDEQLVSLLEQSGKKAFVVLSNALQDEVNPIGGKKTKEAQTLLKTAVSSIDSAASKGVIKRGTASRSISRLTVAVSNLK